MIKNRDEQMDILRGLGIVFVVLGHTVSPINHFIYLFHIIIFFIISGYFFKDDNIKDEKSLKKFMLKKVKRLYIPYILVNIICVLLNNFFIRINMYSISTHYYFTIKDIVKNIVKILLFNGVTEMAGATWFLQILFVVTIFYGMIEFLIKKFEIKNSNIIQMSISIIFLLFGYFLALKEINLKIINISVFTCYIFFDFGRNFKTFKIELSKYKRLLLLLISFILLLILNNLGTIEISKNIYTNLTFYISVSIIGWIFVYELSYFFTKTNIIKNIFIYIGQNTMSILILHFFIFKIINFIGVIITKEDISLMSTFPVLFTGKYCWIIYTLFGIIIPIILEKILKILKINFERKKYEIRSSNSNV